MTSKKRLEEIRAVIADKGVDFAAKKFGLSRETVKRYSRTRPNKDARHPNAKKLIVFGDVHFPHQNPAAIEVLKNTIELFKPDISICLGDLLDCGQFSRHPPTFGVPETSYSKDLEQANELIDFVQAHTNDKTVLIEGNHEFRINRWAAAHAEGRGTYNLLAPRIQLMKGREKCTYVPYGNSGSGYPHYRINSRIAAIHGWSYAQNATKDHLRKSQGMSIIHGHTHRDDACKFPDIWEPGVIQARSAACLCMPVPLWGLGTPNEWTNGFVMGYLGKRSDTLFTVTINDDFAILPDGTEIRAG